MSQRKILLLIIIVAVSFGLWGCARDLSAPGEQTSEDSSNTIASTLPDSYRTKLIFVKQTGEHWLAVDERGVVHEISQTDPNLTLTPGTICDNAQVTVNFAGEYQVEYDYPYSRSYVLKLKSSFAEAPHVFAQWMLDNTLYSGDNGLACSEYILKDVQVAQTYDSGRIDAVMTFDIKPLPGAYYWGKPEADGFIRDLRVNYTIYGADDTWLSLKSLPHYLEAEGIMGSPPPTHYTPSATQNVIYEDEVWSYYGDQIPLPPRNEMIKEYDIVEYTGTINRINRQTGKVEQLYEGDRNYTYHLFTAYEDKLYLLSDTWEPFSEGFPGYFGVLDLQTLKYRKLYDGAVINGTVRNDKGYLFANDQIVEIDLKTAAIRPIGTLPVKISYTYDFCKVNCLIGDQMYFTVYTWDLIKDYVVNLTTGMITEL